jgi:inner membrane protein involved in colicin E2 resistance
VSYTIIYIPTKSNSNEIESLVVVFIPLQLTLGCVVECSRYHVRLLDDLPNDMTLAQEIVASLVFPVTKILAIENHQLNSTFLHVTFRSQSLLKPTGDQTDSDTN